MNLFTDWRATLRHWSLWCAGSAALLLGYALTLPDLVNQLPPSLAADIMAALPADHAREVAWWLSLAATASKFIKQDFIYAQLAALRDWLRTMSNGGNRGQ